MTDGSGNGSGRYEEITNFDDIVAGIGKKESAEDISNFLLGWAEWLAQIIEAVKGFIKEISTAIKNSD